MFLFNNSVDSIRFHIDIDKDNKININK